MGNAFADHRTAQHNPPSVKSAAFLPPRIRNVPRGVRSPRADKLPFRGLISFPLPTSLSPPETLDCASACDNASVKSSTAAAILTALLLLAAPLFASAQTTQSSTGNDFFSKVQTIQQELPAWLDQHSDQQSTLQTSCRSSTPVASAFRPPHSARRRTAFCRP